jgi:hypothetical protein
MITQNNIKEVLQLLSPGLLVRLINGNDMYCLLEVHIFNVGATATLEFFDYYDEVTEQEANDNGQLYCECEQLANICNELNLI